jgi:glycosyltransferase involved in cell wall biosynthesis
MPVRILHVIGDSKFGGASLGILRLASFWRTLNWEVDVLATDAQFQAAAASYGVNVVPLDVIWREVRPLRDLLGLLRLFLYLRSNRYTIVHTHTTKAGFIGRVAAWLAGVPVIIHTAHGFAFHESSPKARIAFFVAMDRIASWCCDKVVTVSHFHARWGRRLGIAAPWKIMPIPNGIPDVAPVSSQRRLEIRRSLGLQEDSILLLTHGRLAPEKGLEDLLQAVAQIGSRTPQLLLALAGVGPLRGPLENQARQLGIGDRVMFLGFRQDVSELLAAADIVVLPTWREGLSIALLEAMAAGCCIVTTSIGPNREPTRDGLGAALVPPNAPDQLASTIEHLIGHPQERNRYATNAREIFEANYSLPRMLERYHQTYRTLLEEKELAYPVSAVLSSHDR